MTLCEQLNATSDRRAKLAVLRGAGYSYGVFLYGDAIQQAVRSASPVLHYWRWNAQETLPVVTAFAALSWHFVEKPALRLRAAVYAIEGYWIRKRKGFARPRAGQLAERSRIPEPPSSGVIVTPGVTIGAGAIVGAYSVVTRDLPPGVVVADVPARVIKTLAEHRDKVVTTGDPTKRLAPDEKRHYYEHTFRGGGEG